MIMRDFWAWATLVVGGIIVADIIANPAGVSAAGKQINGLAATSFNALLGKTS